MRPSEVISDLERSETCLLDSENGFLDLDNWFLEFGILKFGDFGASKLAPGRILR